MRIGIGLPFKDRGNRPLDADGVAHRARMIEEAGFDGAWVGDASFRRLATWPDPLLWLLVAATATDHLELGTAIYQIPLRPAVDLARRFLTLEALVPRRFSIGVGQGSTRAGFNAVGVLFEDRFRRFDEHIATIRALCKGDAVGAADLAPWPSALGGPRLLLGAWRSEASLRRAATEFDGWICSARHSTYTMMKEAITRFRDLGGRRAILASCAVDLERPTAPMEVDEPFNLCCGPTEAAERLASLAAIGFDDVVLNVRDPAHPGPFEGDLTEECLEAVRDLLPVTPAQPCRRETSH